MTLSLETTAGLNRTAPEKRTHLHNDKERKWKTRALSTQDQVSKEVVFFIFSACRRIGEYISLELLFSHVSIWYPWFSSNIQLHGTCFPQNTCATSAFRRRKRTFAAPIPRIPSPCCTTNIAASSSWPGSRWTPRYPDAGSEWPWPGTLYLDLIRFIDLGPSIVTGHRCGKLRRVNFCLELGHCLDLGVLCWPWGTSLTLGHFADIVLAGVVPHSPGYLLVLDLWDSLTVFLFLEQGAFDLHWSRTLSVG